MVKSFRRPFSSKTNLELLSNSPTLSLEMLRPCTHIAAFIQYLKQAGKSSETVRKDGRKRTKVIRKTKERRKHLK